MGQRSDHFMHIGKLSVATLMLLSFQHTAFPATRVVVIGIWDYLNALTERLPFASNDADLFAAFAKDKTLDKEPLILKSIEATLPTIENELSGIFSQAQSRDTIYLFISARGSARGNLDGYIGTVNASKEKPESGGLPLRFLGNLIDGSKAKRIHHRERASIRGAFSEAATARPGYR